MLSHCANSLCGRPFVRLGEGKLFLIEKEDSSELGLTVPRPRDNRLQPRRVERYWLCDGCQKVWTLVPGRHQAIELLPLPPRPDTGTTISRPVA